jgi:hypothetical protein
MQETRGQPLEQRKRAYKSLRINDQLNWYSNRAKRHERRSQSLTFLTLIFETAGATGGLLHVANVLLKVDLLPVVAAIAAALVAWERARQDSSLAKSYRVTAQELARAEAGVDRCESEDDWSRFVAVTEDAISREHRIWRTSRS